MARPWDVAIIGGGAAGLAAAIAAARAGVSAVIADRMPRLGKKILATGGGRCNLSHEPLSPSVFSSTNAPLVSSVLGQVGADEIREFFRGLGLEMMVEDGRVYPVTNQASSVLRVLELEVRRLGIRVELGFEAVSLDYVQPSFVLAAQDGRRIEARAVVLAAGGKSYPALGSNGSGYALVQRFGHRLVPPVPSAVPVLVKDRMCHALQGQRIRARAEARIDGKRAAEAEGELLFTASGLSGTAALDVSEPISIALNRDGEKNVDMSADLVPFLSEEELTAELARRRSEGWEQEELVTGILPDKFGRLLSGFYRPSGSRPGATASSLAAALKDKRFAVLGTRGWNEAEFTAGGIDAREFDPRTIESEFQDGLFLAGEILDVQGPRGGFNLAWAWASGIVAGRSAAAARPHV
jgi:predicted Rossmann fold flavoprotein